METEKSLENLSEKYLALNYFELQDQFMSDIFLIKLTLNLRNLDQ